MFTFKNLYGSMVENIGHMVLKCGLLEKKLESGGTCYLRIMRYKSPTDA